MQFDPYHRWLGIPKSKQPADYYRLLGLDRFEDDLEAIRDAAERQISHIRRYASGEHRETATKILNELARAELTLSDPKQRADYDLQLRDAANINTVLPSISATRPRRSRPAPTRRRKNTAVELIKVVMGGAAGILLALFIVGLGFGVGPLAYLKSQQKPLADESLDTPADTSPKDTDTTNTEQVDDARPVVKLIDADAKQDADIRSVAKLEPGKTQDDELRPMSSFTNSLGAEMVLIPAGEFMMGSDKNDNEKPVHEVQISKAFYLGRMEVTQQQWQALMGTTPWQSQGKDQQGAKSNGEHAASYIGWDAAVEFCKKLSAKEGKTYRLPTEAEWEYACRAGSTTEYSFGDAEDELKDYAWFHENASKVKEKYPHAVGQKKPNAFGLYDMHGNVWELCQDTYHQDYYKISPLEDPLNDLDLSSSHVIRGGPWFGYTDYCRSARRHFATDLSTKGSGSGSGNGFRVVCELDRGKPTTLNKSKTEPIVEVKREFVTNSLGAELVLIPAGEFMMGSEKQLNEKPVHKVRISKPFYLGATEVTQKQWTEVMGATVRWNRNAKVGDAFPATYVSWNDAVDFCKKLSAKEGKTYRLPTEAEWEYACRAGSTTEYSFGDAEDELKDYAWFDKNALKVNEKYPHAVGQKKPNAFGLYDMHGNVWELCQDTYDKDYYKNSPQVDPINLDTGSFRVLRGGSCQSPANGSRSAHRIAGPDRVFNGGFRVLCELEPGNRTITPDNPKTEPIAEVKRESVTNSLGAEMVLIPAGEFRMGSVERSDEKPVHKVRISKAFYLSATEVTQEQWEMVMKTIPWQKKYGVKSNGEHAASYVSWDDAVEFCKKLSEKEGKKYRLPTEAEWEYACRAGSTTEYSFGDAENELKDYAWSNENALNVNETYAHAVGQKKPNAFGLYDMHGNVWEWCQDLYKNFYKNSPQVDPINLDSDLSRRVLRGGSWFDNSEDCRSSRRANLDASERFYNYGFRVLRELE